MENGSASPKKKLNFETYAVVVAFLCLEVLAFVSFYLGHSFMLYAILSIVLVALLILVTLRQINKDGIATFIFFLFPIFIFGLLTALSLFSYQSIGAVGVAESVFVPIGLTLFALAGFLSSYIKKFNIKLCLLVIYISLGLFVLINFILTMVYYVPFYTLTYANSYIVYNGRPSEVPIGSMAYMLFGFSVEEVSLLYWTLFPSLLLTAVIPLFFIKFKENKCDFLIYAGLTFLAFISLLFTINKITLISDFILILGIAIIIVAAKIKKSHSILNVMMTTLGIIVLLVLIVFFINAQKNWGFVSGIRNAIGGNSLFNRLFNTNRYASSINAIFQDLFSSFKLFGCPVGGEASDYPNVVAQVLSNIWLFDNLMSSGLFGAIFFLVALVFGIRRLFKYIASDKDDDLTKYTITGFVLGFLVISLICFDAYPLINSGKIFPFYTCAPLLIVLFLLGYTYNKTLDASKEKKASEPVEEVKEETEDEIISL